MQNFTRIWYTFVNYVINWRVITIKSPCYHCNMEHLFWLIAVARYINAPLISWHHSATSWTLLTTICHEYTVLLLYQSVVWKIITPMNESIEMKSKDYSSLPVIHTILPSNHLKVKTSLKDSCWLLLISLQVFLKHGIPFSYTSVTKQ